MVVIVDEDDDGLTSEDRLFFDAERLRITGRLLCLVAVEGGLLRRRRLTDS